MINRKCEFMNFIESLKKRAKQDKKTIVLPESMDARVIEAASIILKEDIANIIIIGSMNEIEENLKKHSFF